MFHYVEGCLRNVWLANCCEFKKAPFDEGVAFQNLHGLTESICIAMTNKADVLTGSAFRYIPCAGMLLSQPALGKLLYVDGQSVARWKKTSKVPRWAKTCSTALHSPCRGK